MRPTPDRKAAEREFYNETYAAERRQSLNGFYWLSAGLHAYDEAILHDCASKDVLEYGCGVGGYAFTLAERGANVTGIDISDVAVRKARERAAGDPRLTFRVADAEVLPFEPAAFDLVCGTGILHHLDVARAVREIGRVLRPGGRAVFYEPVGYNPAANLYRRLTPELHTTDEHPLLRRDFRLMREVFPATRLRFFDLFSVGAIPLLRFRAGVAALRALEALDTAVFAVVPPLRLLANVVVIEMRST